VTGTPPQLNRRRPELREGGDDDGSPARERTFFGRWGTNSGPVEEESKEKEENSASTIKNTGLFRRGSGAAWGGNSNTALNSPMGTFGNSGFGGGAMGGFTLQSGDKSKTAATTSTKITPAVQPNVENVDERAENEVLHKGVLDTAEQDRQRPTTSDTDPYGIGGDRDDQHNRCDEQNSPLPTPGIHDQQRVQSSPFNSGGNINIPVSNNTRSTNIVGTPTKARADFAFSGFGGSREGLGGMGNLGMTGLHHQLQNLSFNQQGQVPLRRSREGSIGNALAGDNEPLSPAETNPFQSPPPEKNDDDGAMNDHNEGGGGLGSVIAGLRRGEGQNIGAPGSDKSGRSSTNGLGSVSGPLGSGFSGLGGPGLWGSGQTTTPGGISSGTPAQSFFSGGLGDLPNPSGGLGGGSISVGGISGAGHFGSASRASRLGPLFPETQHHDDNQGQYESDGFGNDSRFGAFGSRRGFGAITDSPMRERGDVSDLFGFPSARSISNLATAAATQEPPMFGRDRDDPLTAVPHSHQPHPEPTVPVQASAPQGQPLRPLGGAVPPPQQHVMIMPDKLQWVYRDPSGVIQGPFSGLEMHEWYRAGFFTPDLAVRRQEDTEFEQLGALVRKIGNTREPFLVPLPGNSTGGQLSSIATNWSGGGSWLADVPGGQPVQTPGGVQPPFAGSFPTFGTTLTAEQQNALERRKQEEQYLMAKQREFLLQQQMIAKQAAAAQQLHHQSSTQSLHSQPSFGSLHSPSTFAPTTAPTTSIVGSQNTFEPGALLRQAGAAAGVSGVDNLGLSGLGGLQQPTSQFSHQNVPSQQAQQSQEQAMLMQQQQQRFVEQQRQQLQKSYQTQQNQHVEKQALQQAQEQAQQVAAQVQQLQLETQVGDNEIPTEQESIPRNESQIQNQPQNDIAKAPAAATTEQPNLQALSPRSSPAPKPSLSAWGGHAPLVQPFPPPHSQDSPPPSAISGPSDTPSASVAPWAKEVETQAAKTPSLREIQELEAKQAAAREAAEAQVRREIQSQQVMHQPPPPAPGLPSTATWATSPSTPHPSASAWNKPLAKAAPAPGSQRKTLQQIQKEEEARKAKAAAAAASQAAMSSGNPVVSAAGKRYADLASKAATATSPVVTNSAWTTVGPGGKSKGLNPPTAPASSVAVPAPIRTTSATGVVGFPPPITTKKPATVAAPSKPSISSAQEEFVKWCKASMKGLNPGVTRKLIKSLHSTVTDYFFFLTAEQVIETVGNFPSDSEIIADTIYAVSTTMDGRRWADEYIKRRSAAGSGVVIESGANTSANTGTGGWNEVAKARPVAQQPSSGVSDANSVFRVVAGKKKGRRG
jgi:PERQ amino acid-rich with GYF domain-containing protein